MSQQVKKPITAQEQLEMDIMAETELARLQRQFRIMDGDRKAFEEETLASLQKQKRVLRILTKERNELLENLNVATSKSNKRKDSEICAEMQRLVNEHDKYEEAIKTQRVNLKEIEYQINKVKKDVLAYKKKVLTDEQMQQKLKNGQRTVDALQNRLNNCTKKFCGVLTENKALREEIDHLLRERALFNKIWESHLESLNQGKKVMMDIVEQATSAYDQRDEWCQKLQALKIRAHNDLLAHMSEMRELFRQLDHDASLQDFLSVKGQKRIMRDLEEKEYKKRQQAKENLEKEITHYKETLAKVQKLANEEDISKLAAQYIKQEEENFALFNYVNELNHELETLTDNIQNLYVGIDEQKELNKKRAEQQQDTLDSLKAELKSVRDEEEHTKNCATQKRGELELLLRGIEALFHMVHCDNTPILHLLGETGHVNNYNVMVYLGILENKVSELIKMTNYKDKVLRGPEEESVINEQRCFSFSDANTIDILVPENPCPWCVQAFLVSLQHTAVNIPKTREEVKASLNKTALISSVMHQRWNCRMGVTDRLKF